MQKLRKDRAALEAAIGYTFCDRTLLDTALTHSSYSNEAKSKGAYVECNERLEFLGDSVLSIVASEFLFLKFPEQPEGELTRMRSEIVCEKALCVFANKIGLGDYLCLGHGEELGGGRERPSILADAFEALLAAVFIDCGREKYSRQVSFAAARSGIDEIGNQRRRAGLQNGFAAVYPAGRR